jgi:hypothetical protein
MQQKYKIEKDSIVQQEDVPHATTPILYDPFSGHCYAASALEPRQRFCGKFGNHRHNRPGFDSKPLKVGTLLGAVDN